MSLESLEERLTALQETTFQLQQLIDRLAHIDFQPGSVPLNTDEEGSVSGELSGEISQMLRAAMEDQELFQEEVKYVRPEGPSKDLLVEAAEKVGSELARCRFAYRKARLSAKKSVAKAQQAERELMLRYFRQPVSEDGDVHQGGEAGVGDGSTTTTTTAMSKPAYRPNASRLTQPDPRSTLSEQDQQTVGASSNVTNALRRTHDLIAAELSRSEFAHQTLTESSAALKQLNESYGSLDDMLASSKDLLGTLLRSQKSDTWYLQTSMYMLMVTGAWLVFRRLLYGPMWWLVWLPLRILFGIGTTAGGVVMQSGGSGGAGHSEKVVMGGSGAKVSVEGLPKEDLPTAQVESIEVETVGADAIPEAVGKVIDAANEAETLGNLPEEEDVGGVRDQASYGEDSRPRDEL